MANSNNPAKQWESDPNLVLAGPASGSAAGGIGARALVDADLAGTSGAGKSVSGVATGYKLARSAAALSVTGTSNINTGLTTLLSVVASLAEAAALGGDIVSCSALASAGWFQVQVWKRTTSSDCTPIAATSAKLINWIAVGT